MPRPIPGKSYTVENGDTLERIAGRAYGDELQAGIIGNVNQVLSVSAGDVIRIPRLGVGPTLASQQKGLALFLDGTFVPTESLRVISSLDTFLDGWSGTLARTPGADPFLERVLAPYVYPDANIFVAGSELIRGALYASGPVLESRNQVSIEGWSAAADMFDSTAEPPYEVEGVTLEARVSALAEPFQISVTSELEEDGVFDRLTIGETTTIGEHVLDIVRQRGALIQSTPAGLVISKLQPGREVVGTIEEGQPGFSGFGARFDGRARFSVYRVVAESPDIDIEAVTVRDNAVSRPRFTTRKVEDLRRGELDQAAKWEKTKALADALSIPITAQGHFAPNGDVWQPGQLVTFISPTLFINKGFTMLVRSVELVQEAAGDSAVVTVVPPSVYFGEDLVEPWS